MTDFVEHQERRLRDSGCCGLAARWGDRRINGSVDNQRPVFAPESSG
jgi:hypothetical protein